MCSVTVEVLGKSRPKEALNARVVLRHEALKPEA